MSCYIVDDETITAIVDAIIDCGKWWHDIGNYCVPTFVYPDTRQRMGQRLLEQNVRSWNARYPKDKMDECPRYEIRRLTDEEGNERPFTIGEMMGCVECYEYQACETEDWETTQEHDVCQRLENILAHRAIYELGQSCTWGARGIEYSHWRTA